MHGGDSGEINYGPQSQKEYVFECSLAENRKLEKEHELPTLRQVFELVDKKCFLNIEIKVPYEQAIRDKYDWKRAVSTVHNLIKEF